MPDLPPIVLAALTGFISGLLLSVPIGPINLTIVNEGARRGFKWAALIGLGATLMEVIYCFIAFTSFASFITDGVATALAIGSCLFMLYLGIKFLLARPAMPARVEQVADRIEARIGEQFPTHSPFMTGVVRVMGNVGVLAFWIVLATSFMSRGWVTPNWPGKCACVAGVTLGTGMWFMFLSWVVSLSRRKFNEATLLRMERFSGVLLLGLAAAQGGSLLWHVWHHK